MHGAALHVHAQCLQPEKALAAIEQGPGLAHGLGAVYQIADAVVFPFQIFHRINLGQARHQDAAAIRALLGKVSHVNIAAFAVNAVDQPVIVFLGGVAEVPVRKRGSPACRP